MLIARRTGPQRVEVVHLDPESTSMARGWKFRKRLIRNETEWVGFWLFTFPPEAFEDQDKPSMHRKAQEVWKRFRARMWEAGYPFKFVLVTEWTKAGFPHFHVLVDRFIPKHEKGDFKGAEYHWVESGGGIFLKAKHIRGNSPAERKKAINYICKYITKYRDRVAGCRRWAYSNRLLEAIRKKVSEWFVIHRRDIATLTLDNDVLVDEGSGVWNYLELGWAERGG